MCQLLFSMIFIVDRQNAIGHGASMKAIQLPTPDEIEVAATARGLTVAAMCRRADIDQATFSRWKRGDRIPSVRIIQRMIDAIEREPKIKKGRG